MGAASSRRDDRVLATPAGSRCSSSRSSLVAFVILYLFPTHTARLWAWTIPVTMTSMMLASAYLGGAYFFVRVVPVPTTGTRSAPGSWR